MINISSKPISPSVFSCSSFVSTPLIPHRQYLTRDHSRAEVQNPYFIWQLSFVTYRRYYAQRVGDRWSKICLLYVRRQEVNNIQLSDKMITLYTVSVEQILFLNVAWKYSYSVTGNIAQQSCSKYLTLCQNRIINCIFLPELHD